jgi:hypothetical protein
MSPHATRIECAGWFHGTPLEAPPARVDAFCEHRRRHWQTDDTTAMFIRFGDVEHTSEIGRGEAWTPR